MGHLRVRIWLAFIFLIVIADWSILYADDSVRLMVGRSTVINMGSPITRVSLTSADVADALVTTPTEVLINGKMPGTISMFVWDRAGAIRKYEIVVQRDLARLSEQLAQLFPGERIDAQSNGHNIVLAGIVSRKDVIERAVELAAGYVEKKEEVVSLLQLREGAPTNQVLLRVRFAEVNRTALTQLGASFFTSPNGYKEVVGRVSTEQFPAPGFTDRIGPPPPTNPTSEGKFSFTDFLNLFLFSTKYQVGTVIQALQTRGVFQSLAEPNLVAESGKEASFLAGGEFPVPVAQPSAGTTTVTVIFKEFGIRLTFTPTVVGNRVHLKVKPEVSSLDFGNAVTLAGFRIPALSTRRTETELELENGQTFAISGLLNQSVTKSLQKMPGIGDIPVLGLLFRSQSAQKDRTELVVMITPEILPNNSPGLTPNLPRTPDTFLPPLEQKRSYEPQPPAFRPQGQGQANGAAQPAAIQVISPAMPPNEAGVPPQDAATAATKVQALTATAPAVVHAEEAPAAQPAPVGQIQATPAAQMPPQDGARAEPQQHERDEAAKAADGKARKKQLDEERRQAEANQKAEAKAAKAAADEARRQAAIQKVADEAAAKQAAEDARKQAEIDRKQAELDKKNQKAVAEAEAKLKAAQAAYDSEVAKAKKQQ